MKMIDDTRPFIERNIKPETPLFERWETEKRMLKEAEQRALADARSDARALPALAEFYLPADIREFGTRNGIPTFAEACWINAFIVGWRAANRRDDAPAPVEKIV